MKKNVYLDDFKSPLISILVINFNGSKYLGDILDNCIKSIFDNDYENFELLFIDNGSRDDSVEHIRNLFSYDERLKIVELKNNYGTTGAKNRGIKISSGELIYILNTDIYLKKETLKIMSKIMEQNPDIGILSCKLVRPDGEIQSEGESFYIRHSILGIVYPTFYRKLYLNNIKKRGNLNLVDWISGGALMIRKNLFDKLGPYDENYFMYSEEVDIAYKVKRMGYKVACITDYETIHYHKLTAKHYSRWQSDLVCRNQLLFMLKNYRGQKLAMGLGYYILGIAHNFLVSLLKLDEVELKRGFSRIRAFSYAKTPPKGPNI